jgi:hypothetical protein
LSNDDDGHANDYDDDDDGHANDFDDDDDDHIKRLVLSTTIYD